MEEMINGWAHSSTCSRRSNKFTPVMSGTKNKQKKTPNINININS